jgi:hypothetical protein
MPNITDAWSASDLPKAVELKTCEFPIVEGNVNGYQTIELPQGLRKIFDQQHAHVVRVSSIGLAKTIPDYGGKASGDNYSLLPHQDHLNPAGDRRRFLMLSKLTDGARGSTTLIIMPGVAAAMLSDVEAWVKNDSRRAQIGAERNYDKRFRITEQQYNDCFDDKNGYERAVAAVMERGRGQEFSARLGIMGYLVRGLNADKVMGEITDKFRGKFYQEKWESGGMVIIDNSRVFHARLGGNKPALKRNFCT